MNFILAMVIMYKHIKDIIGHTPLQDFRTSKSAGYSTKTLDVYNPQNIRIGHASLVQGTIIASKDHTIKIGDKVQIAPYTTITNYTRKGWKSNRKPLLDCPMKSKNMVIGSGSWIGSNCTILANIGKGCVVGAGSIVTKDLPDYAVAYGNPCKVRYYRNEKTKRSVKRHGYKTID